MSANHNSANSGANSSAVAPATGKSNATAGGCSNCGSEADWGHSSWCPRCGWYPALNTCVEVDPIEDEAAAPEKPPEWWEVIPMWAWLLGIGEVGLICLSVFARITMPLETGERARWALIQLFIGAVAFLAGHAWAFFYAVMKTSDFGLLDIISRPLAIWKPSNVILPKSFPRLAMAVWGLSAVLLAVGVIGGINYNALFEDWGFEEQAQANIVHEIVRQAREADGGDESMEDAMNDFVGDQGASDAQQVETIQLDCLIIGYLGESPEEFTGLAVAALVDGKLQYVGTVFRGFSDEDREVLAGRMAQLGRERSIVNAKVAAKWLQPKLMCRVQCEELSDRLIMKNPIFKLRLADAQ